MMFNFGAKLKGAKRKPSLSGAWKAWSTMRDVFASRIFDIFSSPTNFHPPNYCMILECGRTGEEEEEDD